MPRVQHKRGTAAALAAVNPTPLAGELVYESDTYQLKVGDGSTPYNSLPYVSGGGGGGAAITDGDKGDISVSGSGSTWTIDSAVLSSFGRTLIDDANATAALTTLGAVASSDSRLTDSREWSADTVTQAEAEAGTATTRRAWTALRVFQAVAAWWAASAAKTKLDGIATGATANSTDAQLRDRTTHTGTQAISSVDGLQAALDAKAASSHTHISTDISDSTAAGRSLLTAADAAAQRTALDAAASSHTHVATAISDSTAAGRSLLTAADAAAQRTSLGLGTMATATATDYLARSGGTMTGQLVIPTGSASAPGIGVTSDTNCGLAQLGGTDTLGIVTAGVERWRVGPVGQRSSVVIGGSTLLPEFACRAWVNFNGTANSSLSGTYSRSGTTVTVTATAHGLAVGQDVYLDFTSGTATDGTFTVASVADANTFTITHGTSGTTSGNVTLARSTIRGSGNVSSVADINVGNWLVNFSTAMPDGNYAVCVSGRWDTNDNNSSSPVCGLRRMANNPAAGGVRIVMSEAGTPTAGADAEVVSVIIFR